MGTTQSRLIFGLTVCVLVPLSLAGCRFDESLPAGARVPCEADGDCPTTDQCDAQLKVCVAANSPFVVTTPVKPPRGRAGDVFSFQLSTGALNAAQLTAVALDSAGAQVATFTFDLELGRWAWTATGAEPEGRHRVFVSVKPGAGEAVVNLVEVGAFELDFTAPSALDTTLRVLATEDNALVIDGYPDLLTAGRAGSTLEARFRLSELVTGLPRVSLLGEDAGVACTVTALGESFQATAVLPGDVAQGRYALRIEAADLVGNAAALDGASLEVRTTAPPTPALSVPGAVVYRRAPWGTLESDAPLYEVHGEPGAALGSVAVAAISGVYPVGRARVNPDGSFLITLRLEGDAPTVALRAIDAAGNESPLAEVLEVEWIISALQADAGTLFQAGVYDPLHVTAEPPDITAERRWVTSGGVVVRQPNHAETFAPNAMFELGRYGFIGRSFWVDGQNLQDPTSNSSPCLFPHQAQAFDPRLGSVCVGGGQGLPLGDGGLAGAERWWPAIAIGGGRALILGGETDAGIPLGGGLWFDGTTVTPVANPQPPPRGRQAMAFDPLRQRFLIFGGVASGVTSGETWAFEDGGFVQLGGPQPPARAGASLAWDRKTNRVLLAGGLLHGGVAAQDTWVHDGSQWREIDAGAYVGRMGGRLLQHPGTGTLLWGDTAPFDGGADSPPMYVFKNDAWVPVLNSVALYLPTAVAFGYQPDLGAVVAAGGSETDAICGEDDCTAFISMTQEPMAFWKDWRWTTVPATASTPLFAGGRLGWDPSSRELVVSDAVRFLDGGSVLNGPLYAMDQRTQARWSPDGGWTTSSLPSGGASTYSGSYARWDDGRLLLHGGFRPDGGLSDETWALDQVGWHLLEVGPAVARPTFLTLLSDLAPYSTERWLADAPTHQSVLVTSRQQYRFDTHWSAGLGPLPAFESQGVGRPSGYGALTQHPFSGAPLALGDGQIATLEGATWRFKKVPTLNLSTCDAVLDPQSRQVVWPSYAAWFTQVLDFSAGQPVQAFGVPLTRSAMPGDARVLASSVRWRGGASGSAPDGGSLAGLVLLQGSSSTRALMPVPASVGAAGTTNAHTVVAYENRELADLERSLRTADGGFVATFTVGATSAGVNGTGEAQLSTSGVEYTLRWRRDGGTP